MVCDAVIREFCTLYIRANGALYIKYKEWLAALFIGSLARSDALRRAADVGYESEVLVLFSGQLHSKYLFNEIDNSKSIDSIRFKMAKDRSPLFPHEIMMI